MRALGAGILSVALATSALAADLSPKKWPAEERDRLEALEKSPWEHKSQVIEAQTGLISATMSPLAIRAGLEALKQGGTAADAAATIALTQVTTALGSYVSYAGALQLVYYDSRTATVYSMNAGWSSYQNELDPGTIPVGSKIESEQGRKTLVPGFMRGIEAMQHRFGVLPFAELFEPAIWYCEHGVTISPMLARYFASRQSFLRRTAEGRAFLAQSGRALPIEGDLFLQPEAGQLLRSVARDGAQFMYTGQWGKNFVAAVEREGGRVTLEDLQRYQPIWEEPLSTEFLGHTVFAPGRSTQGGLDALQGLNLIEATKLHQSPPYWRSAQSFVDLSQILEFVQIDGSAPSWISELARTRGIELAPEKRGTRSYSKASLQLLKTLFSPPPATTKSDHSDAIVVIDQWGNVAALVHTINAVLWGTTGMVVDGVPLSDAASFQQTRLARLKPGDHVPSEMAPLIVMTDQKPSLAIAAIGAALHAETMRILLGTLGNRLDPLEVMAAPPLLLNYDFGRRGMVQVPEKAYDESIIKGANNAGLTLKTVSMRTANRGTAVIGVIDPSSKVRRSLESPGIISFAQGY